MPEHTPVNVEKAPGDFRYVCTGTACGYAQVVVREGDEGRDEALIAFAEHRTTPTSFETARERLRPGGAA